MEQFKGGEVVNCFLFKGLTETESTVAETYFSQETTFQKGDELYRCGFLTVLTKGSAKVKRINELGGTITVRNVRAGEVFGSASVFGSWSETKSSVIADSVCTCRYISEKDLQALLLHIPKTATNYIAFLSEKIRFLNRRLDTFSADSSEQRIYEYFLSISDENGKAEPSVSMAELARRLKIGRTSLYRCLNSLESNGMLTRKGRAFYIK